MSNSALDTPPGLLKRLASIGYDAFLVFALLFAATGLVLLAEHLLVPTPEAILAEGDVVNELPLVAQGPWFNSYLFMVMFLFYAYFWCRIGQTLGMQAWRLRIDSLDGNRISFRQAAIRFVGAWVSMLALGLGYLWVLIDKDKRSWHDIWSKTKVVQLEKSS